MDARRVSLSRFPTMLKYDWTCLLMVNAANERDYAIGPYHFEKLCINARKNGFPKEAADADALYRLGATICSAATFEAYMISYHGEDWREHWQGQPLGLGGSPFQPRSRTPMKRRRASGL